MGRSRAAGGCASGGPNDAVRTALLRARDIDPRLRLNFLDRTIFNVLIEPIKQEFALSDTTMACSRASASCCSIRCSAFPSPRCRSPQPAQHHRHRICVLERDDVSLRLGVERHDTGARQDRRSAIGESAGTPASQSLVADLFDKNERPRALGVYAIAPISRVPGLFHRRAGSTSTMAGGWRSCRQDCPESPRAIPLADN